ncbi:MarR family winged helix-turn-helix transcriptional regulator [Cryobacterium arcticum]|nr:MarR family transcriptional regulator [Cryobacterium arcticum]
MPTDAQPAGQSEAERSGGFWYPASGGAPLSAVDVLRAVRRFRAADLAMRNRVRSGMDMHDTDLVAVRHLIAAEERGEPIGPKDLTRHLGISTAATAKLLTRLEAAGRLRREPHPSDRRAQVLHATGAAHEEVRRALGSAHQRMLAAAEKLSPSEQHAVVRFLDELSGAMDEPPEQTEPTRDGEAGAVETAEGEHRTPERPQGERAAAGTSVPPESPRQP